MLKAVLVTGGRDYEDRQHVFDVLDNLRPAWLIVGDCPSGADRWAREWARADDSCFTQEFVAQWSKHGRKAGPLRNGEMVDAAVLKGAEVVAFPGGAGPRTACARLARRGLKSSAPPLPQRNGAKMGKMREYKIELGTDEGARTTLQMHIDTLEGFRPQHPAGLPRRAELEWEIAVYRYMQNDPEPAKRLKEYNDARYDKDHIPGPKRDAIKKLGWVIPG